MAGRDTEGGTGFRGRIRSPRVLVAVVATVSVIAVGGAFLLADRTSAKDYSCLSELSNPPGVSGAEGFATDSLGTKHVPEGAKVTYAYCPPASGEHRNAPDVGPIAPGFHDAGSVASPAGWVHNLEHGYVVALYSCRAGACPSEADLAALRTFAALGSPQVGARCEGRPKVVVARFDDMSKPYALLAWDRALMLDAFDPSVARDFASRWIDVTAPEKNGC